MKPYDIGFLVCFGIWLFAFLLARLADKADDDVGRALFVSMEFTALLGETIFMGFGNGWW